ncbi:MAG: apolipoprotein N-acyltransferase [Candidatus Rokubacteria bacterium]|nr:apolipoprotein N-acyltransferase [Candidatus Rokubacteria bacterium]
MRDDRGPRDTPARREGWLHVVLVTLAGGVLALAFPRPGWAGAAWVALAPVFAVALLRRPRAALGLGWLAGTVFFLALLRWLDFTFRVYSNIPWPLTWFPTFLLAAYCGLYTGLVATALSWISHRRSPSLALAAAPCLWVAGEWIRGWLMGGFPWGNVGYSQWRELPVIQIAELGGIHAVSFVLVAANAALAGLVVLSRRRGAAGLAIAVALVGATFGFGVWRLSEVRSAVTRADAVKVAVMQPAIEQPLKWDPRHTETTLRVYDTLMRAAVGERPALIVWPETASPTVLGRDHVLTAALARLSRESGVPLLVGSIDVEDGTPPRVRNTAFLLTERGIINRYDKMQLVPFGEYVPLSRIIGFVRGWADFISELEPGTRAVVFPGPPAPFGVMICYEGIFPALVRTFVRNCARLMVNMTNDGWFGRTSGPLQHLTMYPFRAVEHRVTVARAANTGVSAFILPTGEIAEHLDLFERGNVVRRVPLRTLTTLYTRWGDWVVYAALAATGAVLVLAGMRPA